MKNKTGLKFGYHTLKPGHIATAADRAKDPYSSADSIVYETAEPAKHTPGMRAAIAILGQAYNEQNAEELAEIIDRETAAPNRELIGVLKNVLRYCVTPA